VPSPCSQTPVGPLHLAVERWFGAAPVLENAKGSREEKLSGLNRTASARAVYASSGRLPDHDARLAAGCWLGSARRDWRPAGFHRKVSELPLIPLSQACLTQYQYFNLSRCHGAPPLRVPLSAPACQPARPPTEPSATSGNTLLAVVRSSGCSPSAFGPRKPKASGAKHQMPACPSSRAVLLRGREWPQAAGHTHWAACLPKCHAVPQRANQA
jgi:hypothetical protein